MFDNMLQDYINMLMSSAGNVQTLPTPVAPVTSVLPPALQQTQPVVAPTTPTPVPVPVPVVDPQTQAREQYRKQADDTFGVDYGRKNITSSLLDDTIHSIMSEQSSDANSYLDRGRARGIYSDAGYNAGMARLYSSYEAGKSKLGELGAGVIDKYRANADAVRDKAYAAASSYTPGSSFSLDPYINEGNEVIHRANEFAGGDLRNAFGGTKIFDFGDLNNRAGQAQGNFGGRDLDVLTAIGDRKRANSLGRGLGSRGAF